MFSVSSGVAAEDVKDSKYHTYKITTASLHKGMYLWLAPAANPDNVENVYVDRFWLVREK